MNPKVDNARQYLRISLSCASWNDMMEACDARDLDILQKEFPILNNYIHFGDAEMAQKLYRIIRACMGG